MKFLNTCISSRITAVSLLFFVIICHPLSINAAVLSVTPSSASIEEGNSFSVDISITGVSDLFAFEFNLGFDPSILSASNVTEGPFLQSGGPTLWLPGIIDNTSGLIEFTGNSLQGFDPGVSGDGVLVHVDFISLTTGSSNINLFNAILLDSFLSDISVDNVQNANITVTASSAQTPTIAEPGILALFAISLIGFIFIRSRHLNKELMA